MKMCVPFLFNFKDKTYLATNTQILSSSMYFLIFYEYACLLALKCKINKKNACYFFFSLKLIN
jgi:hypothetical protein